MPTFDESQPFGAAAANAARAIADHAARAAQLVAECADGKCDLRVLASEIQRLHVVVGVLEGLAVADPQASARAHAAGVAPPGAKQ